MLLRDEWSTHMDKITEDLEEEKQNPTLFQSLRDLKLFDFFQTKLIKYLNKEKKVKRQKRARIFCDIWTTFDNFTYRKCGMLMKMPGSRHGKTSCHKACAKFIGEFKEKMFCINEDGIGFTKLPKEKDWILSNKKQTIKDFRVWDSKIKIFLGPNSTQRKFGISIFTATTNLELDGGAMIPLMNWLTDILSCINKSPYTTQQRFESFSFVREKNFAKWYIDQQDPVNGDYYGDIHDAIEKAEKKVFITDWFLTPEIFLKRPIKEYPESRLDDTLLRAAKRGVRVNIIIWQNSPVTGNNSLHTETYLEELHENIEVLRHPPKLIWFWSHHEKMVVVDGEIGFCGGIDLAMGRYEHKNYPITEPIPGMTIWPGKDYHDGAVCDYKDVKNYNVGLFDKKTMKRMPRRDIAMQIRGEIVVDLIRHFIQYWNFVKYDLFENKTNDPAKNRALYVSSFKQEEDICLLNVEDNALVNSQYGDKNEAEKCGIELSHIHSTKPLRKSSAYWKQKWKDAIVKVILNRRKTLGQEDDIEMVYNDIIRHNADNNQDENLEINQEQKDLFTSKVLDTKDNSKFSRFSLSKTLRYAVDKVKQYTIKKKEYSESFKANAEFHHSRTHASTISFKGIFRTQQQLNDKISLLDTGNSLNSSSNNNCQLTRSGGKWSLGLDAKGECSIYNAYLEQIDEANDCIYIENQFFVSSASSSINQNKLVDGLIDKLKRKITAKEDFQLVIFQPLVPGFPGQVNKKSGNAIRSCYGYFYNNLSRGGKSIIESVASLGVDPTKYVKVFGLRNHGVLQNGTPATSHIYIHSKLMIVDEKRALIGSANINDRSLLGQYDTELAIVTEDATLVSGIVNGKKQFLPKFSYSLRKHLFMNSFDMLEEEVEDIMNPDMWKKIEEQCNHNNHIYRQIFGCWPDNKMLVDEDVDKVKGESDVNKYDSLKDQIKGYAVSYPQEFLVNEDLSVLKYYTLKDSIAPELIYV